MYKEMTSKTEEFYKKAGCAKYECTHKVQKYCDECKGCRDTYFDPYPSCLGDECNKYYKNMKFIDCFTEEKQYKLLKVLYKNFGFKCLDSFAREDSWKESIAKLACFYWDVLSKETQEEIRKIIGD